MFLPWLFFRITFPGSLFTFVLLASGWSSLQFVVCMSWTLCFLLPGSCRRRLDGTSGEIESPNVGELYTRVLRCVWLIDNEDPHYVIEMNFNLLRISENQQCLFDYVMIEDISGRGARTLGRFCGSALPSGKIIGQKLRVTYRLEDISRQFGFKLKWVKKVKNIEDAKSRGNFLY